MDNGLIFPYPRKSVPAEPGNAKSMKRDEPSGDLRGTLEPIQ